MSGVQGHGHVFDHVSGYCRCGYREDGRLVNRDGVVYREVFDPISDQHRIDQIIARMKESTTS